VGGEAFGRHPNPRLQPARHHPPADETLEPTEDEQAHARPRQAARKAAGKQQPDQRQGEGHAEEPAEQPVTPFPPEDRLEAGEGHVRIDHAILRDRAVAPEQIRPFRAAHRRQGAGYRLPIGDRKARSGQPRRPAEHHHPAHDRRDREQPHRRQARPLRPIAARPGRGDIRVGNGVGKAGHVSRWPVRAKMVGATGFEPATP
jgi:hypothetical protein